MSLASDISCLHGKRTQQRMIVSGKNNFNNRVAACSFSKSLNNSVSSVVAVLAFTEQQEEPEQLLL